MDNRDANIPLPQRKQKGGRSASTRARLTSAALDMMGEGGEETVSLADVAERAGVTRGTVYHHFRKRTDLIDAARQRLEAALETIANVTQDAFDPYGEVAKAAGEDPAIFRSHLRQMLRDGPTATPALRANIERFNEFKATGRLQPNVDPFVGAMLAVSGELAALLVMQTARTTEEKAELERRFSITYHRFLLHGILNAEAPGGWPEPQAGTIE